MKCDGFAQYTPSVVYPGNPFIEALPAMLSSEELYSRTANYPSCEVTGKYNSLIQLQRLPLIEQTYQPTSFTQDLYIQIYCALQTSYSLKEYLDVPRREGIATSTSLVGVSGMGKSITVKKLLSLFPQIIMHTEYQGKPFATVQLSYLMVETPHNASVRSLCIEILKKVDEATGSKFVAQYTKRGCTVDVLVAHITSIAKRVNLGLMVIDEIQNIVYGRNDELLNFVVQLSNSANISLCFVGTPKAIEPITRHLRAARRATGLILDRYDFGDDFNLVLDALWRFQCTRKRAALTPELREYLYTCCSGNTSVLVQLLMYAQEIAIRANDDCLEKRHFEAAKAKKMKLLLKTMEDTIGIEGTDANVGSLGKKKLAQIGANAGREAIA